MDGANARSWFPFTLDPEVERWWRALLRAVHATERERPCRTITVPQRLVALRQLAGLRRWAVLIAAPGYLRGIGHVHALLARTPEVMSCRVEPIDSRGARMVLMTVQLELDEVTRLVQECSRRSGCPAAVRVVALGSAYDDADLR